MTALVKENAMRAADAIQTAETIHFSNPLHITRKTAKYQSSPPTPSPRQEVIEILARGLCELVMRGCKPDQPKKECHPCFGHQGRRRNSEANQQPAKHIDR